jgi:hypothetical protein
MIFKNLDRTSKRTPHFTNTNINWFTLFKKKITVYSENHKNPLIQNAELLTVEVVSTYNNPWF